MAKRKAPSGSTKRSSKAGKPPQSTAAPARVRRRAKRATAAYKKDTTIHQAGEDPRAAWPAARPKFKKR
jgi:hypothetical protein